MIGIIGLGYSGSIVKFVWRGVWWGPASIPRGLPAAYAYKYVVKCTGITILYPYYVHMYVGVINYCRGRIRFVSFRRASSYPIAAELFRPLLQVIPIGQALGHVAPQHVGQLVRPTHLLQLLLLFYTMVIYIFDLVVCLCLSFFNYLFATAAKFERKRTEKKRKKRKDRGDDVTSKPDRGKTGRGDGGEKQKVEIAKHTFSAHTQSMLVQNPVVHMYDMMCKGRSNSSSVYSSCRIFAYDTKQDLIKK